MSESIVHSRNATIRIHFFKLRGFKFGVYWFTILLILSFANSFLLSIQFLLRESTFNALLILVTIYFTFHFGNLHWTYYSVREFTYDSLFLSEHISNSLSFSWIHQWFTLFFCEFSLNSLYISQIHYQFPSFFAISLLINYVFR